MLNDGKPMEFVNIEIDNSDTLNWKGSKVLDQNTGRYITEKQFVHSTNMSFVDVLMDAVLELVHDEDVMDRFIEDMGVKVSRQGREILRAELGQRVWTTVNDLEHPKWDKESKQYV